jgi:hypothetical protein
MNDGVVYGDFELRVLVQLSHLVRPVEFGAPIVDLKKKLLDSSRNHS